MEIMESLSTNLGVFESCANTILSNVLLYTIKKQVLQNDQHATSVHNINITVYYEKNR